MASKKRLGRGLDALMSDGPAEEETKETEVVKTEKKTTAKAKSSGRTYPAGIEVDDNGTLWLDPKKLKPNPHQPRTTFSEEALNELADSIREHGVLQPITIEDAGDGMFYIIAGERRTRASNRRNRKGSCSAKKIQ